MKIESVDFFYLSMPQILDTGDGSQDALLVRIRAGGLEGWGECEAAPLPTIAAYVCPMSHSACKPVKSSVEGKELNDPSDIAMISRSVHQNSFDLLQADHTLSGIDIALWDLLGKYLNTPVYKLLGYKKPFGKTPYASQLFGSTPEQTFLKALESRESGYKAIKFVWGTIGKNVKDDDAHFRAAREGLGNDLYLMVDMGTVWYNDVEAAKQRVEVLKEVNAYWLEEPFANLALDAYRQLSVSDPRLALAAGEGCNNFLQAEAMLQFAGLRFIQIDAGRVGGITAAKRVADSAKTKRITYVNHTFTSHLALSASLQPFAGIEEDVICEYPVEPKQLATDITKNHLALDDNGQVNVPEAPGLGIDVNTEGIGQYIVDVEISVTGEKIYRTPQF